MRRETPAAANARLTGETLAGIGDRLPPYRHREVIITIATVDGAPLRRFRAGLSARSEARVADAVEEILADFFGRDFRELTLDGPADSYLPVEEMLERSFAYETDGPDRVDEEN